MIGFKDVRQFFIARWHDSFLLLQPLSTPNSHNPYYLPFSRTTTTIHIFCASSDWPRPTWLSRIEILFFSYLVSSFVINWIEFNCSDYSRVFEAIKGKTEPLDFLKYQLEVLIVLKTIFQWKSRLKNGRWNNKYLTAAIQPTASKSSRVAATISRLLQFPYNSWPILPVSFLFNFSVNLLEHLGFGQGKYCVDNHYQHIRLSNPLFKCL